MKHQINIDFYDCDGRKIWLQGNPGRIKQVLRNVVEFFIYRHWTEEIHLFIKYDYEKESLVISFSVKNTVSERELQFFSKERSNMQIELCSILVDLAGGKLFSEQTEDDIEIKLCLPIKQAQFPTIDNLSHQRSATTVAIVDNEVSQESYVGASNTEQLQIEHYDSFHAFSEAEPCNEHLVVFTSSLLNIDSIAKLKAKFLAKQDIASIDFIYASKSPYRGEAEKAYNRGYHGYLTLPVGQNYFIEIIDYVLATDDNILITKHLINEHQHYNNPCSTKE